MRNIVLGGLVLFIALISCKKETLEGPAGPASKNGESNMITVLDSSNNWQQSGNDWYLDFEVEEITQDILDEGVVLAYAEQGGGYVQMPTTLYQGGVSATFSFSYSLKKTHIRMSFSTTVVNPQLNTKVYKFVIFSGK